MIMALLLQLICARGSSIEARAKGAARQTSNDEATASALLAEIRRTQELVNSTPGNRRAAARAELYITFHAPWPPSSVQVTAPITPSPRKPSSRRRSARNIKGLDLAVQAPAEADAASRRPSPP